ncbi:MAG: amidohydrolase family protein [Alphaproteobacteria bacterium]|nr:amidohydrolase family protein [Alphaproteobacteria bacterium]MBV9966566.1 amidohydrolase family protein [Alphaproteobacteria bacterium]
MEPDRRKVLKMMAASAAALFPNAAPAATQVKWSSGAEPPRLKAPAGACDCHHYVYDSRYPIDRRGIRFPGDALAADYRALQRRLGITRQVIIQPSTYGADNRVTLAALGAFGPEARGIVVLDERVSDVELRHMHERGVRGIRFNFAPPGPTTAAMIEPLARRIGDLGWHVEVNAWAAVLPAILPILARLPSPVVLDHLGRIPEPEGAHDRLFAMVRGLLDNGRTWIKLAAAYDATKIGPPTYADSSALARAYVETAPERVVWGSNWPHPGEDPKPDDALLFDLLLDWAPDDGMRHRILVDNPAALYDFPKSA